MSKSGLEFDIKISYLKVMFVFKLSNRTCILIILYSDNTFYLHTFTLGLLYIGVVDLY